MRAVATVTADDFVREASRRIREACGPRGKDHTLPLTEPCFEGNEWAYTKECLDTRWVSSVGKYVDLFEDKLAEFTGARHCVATVNGTAALHVALLLAGVKPGDEVIVPALTFVATANAVAYCGATPHFVDVESTSFGMDAAKLQKHLESVAVVKDGECRNRSTGKRISAAIVVHVFGHAAEMEALVPLFAKWKIPLLEDAAESLGSLYKGKHTGRFGLMGALSFNGNKIITTGGGGALLFEDAALAKHAKHLTTTAKKPHAWDFFHDEIGFNYRLPNINAALGCAQLEKLGEFLTRKRALAERYRAGFSGFAGADFISEPAGRQSNYWLNILLLRSGQFELADVIERFHAEGILVRPAWRLPSSLPMYAASPRSDLSVAEELVKRVVNLPSGASL